MEKISANRETRLRVKPIAHDANSVTANVSTTALCWAALTVAGDDGLAVRGRCRISVR